MAPILTRREIDKALNVKDDTYPGSTECAVCGEIWFAHSGEICPICSVCGVHGLQHTPTPRSKAIEVVEIRDQYVWVLCQGGVTTFLPVLDCDRFDG